MPRIRMLTPDDRAALAALPTESFSRHFLRAVHGVVRVLTTPTPDRLLDLEQGRHEVMIAEIDEGIVAIARYVRDTPTSAEAESVVSPGRDRLRTVSRRSRAAAICHTWATGRDHETPTGLIIAKAWPTAVRLG
jgi:hypothetical protein